METKKCSRCGQAKPVDCFSRIRKWRASKCKACRRELQRERWASMTPEQKAERAEQNNKYRKTNPWMRRARNVNRRHRDKGRVSAKQLKELWNQYDGKCWVCGCDATEFDHFRPINDKAGGQHEISNLRPICRECNYKRDRKWRGADMAEKEAQLLCELKRLLAS